MASSSLPAVFDDPARSQNLALGLGALGAPLVGLGIGLEWSWMLIVGALVLAASGAVWALRGVKEDQVKDAA